MGDGTGCDNMTAVIAKLKPNAFSNKKSADSAAEAVTSSNLTEKTVKPESVSVKAETEAAVASIKRTAEEIAGNESGESNTTTQEESDKEVISEPQAKKAKTDNAEATTEISPEKTPETDKV